MASLADTKWIIGEARAVEPTPGAGCDASYLVMLSRGEQRARSTVEFSAPSSLTSIGYAREVLTPFLADDELPPRVIVSTAGDVVVQESVGA
jgi:hypothetical protein